MTTTTTTTPAFFKLPSELRNQIYELVLAPKGGSLDAVDLLATAPPSKNLLLVSRQIYYEAGKLYKDCYRRFWSESDFTLDTLDKPRGTESPIKSLDVKGLEHIQSLKLSRHGQAIDYHKLLDVPGGWVLATHQGHLVYYRMVKGRKGSAIGLGPMYLEWDAFSTEQELREACENKPTEVALHDQLIDLLG